MTKTYECTDIDIGHDKGQSVSYNTVAVVDTESGEVEEK